MHSVRLALQKLFRMYLQLLLEALFASTVRRKFFYVTVKDARRTMYSHCDS